MVDHERETLIRRLTNLTPYPRYWFEGLTTAQLITMYNLPERKRKHHAAVLIEKDPIDAAHRRYDDETGQWLVKTDGHGWEPEEN